MCARTASRSAGLALAAALTGCGLVMQGTSQEVSFVTEPPGATFSVGGRSSTTPDTFEVPLEDYTIVFRRAGYKDETFELKRQTNSYFYWSLLMGGIAAAVDILTGAWQEFQTQLVTVKLEPLADTPHEIPVKVDSDPPGADVYTGETLHGKTPASLRLVWMTREQQKEITFRLSGYKALTLPLTRLQGELSGRLVLEEVPVKVYVTSNPRGGAVRVDGRLAGETPLEVEVLWRLKDPPKRVEIAKEGYRSVRVDLRGPADRNLHGDLAEVVEELPLRLKVVPAGADVEVDGAAVVPDAAGVPLRWSVTQKNHTVRISHPGFGSKTVDVTRAQAERPLEIRLAPLLPKAP